MSIRYRAGQELERNGDFVAFDKFLENSGQVGKFRTSEILTRKRKTSPSSLSLSHSNSISDSPASLSSHLYLSLATSLSPFHCNISSLPLNFPVFSSFPTSPPPLFPVLFFHTPLSQDFPSYCKDS